MIRRTRHTSSPCHDSADLIFVDIGRQSCKALRGYPPQDESMGILALLSLVRYHLEAGAIARLETEASIKPTSTDCR
jgi:hypothetical protein